jgi:hypothetical protein
MFFDFKAGIVLSAYDVDIFVSTTSASSKTDNSNSIICATSDGCGVKPILPD